MFPVRNSKIILSEISGVYAAETTSIGKEFKTLFRENVGREV